MRRLAAGFSLILAGCAMSQELQPPASRSDEVAAAVDRFLVSFENLDWEPFRKAYADDATVYFPVPEPPRRHSGRAEIELQFRKVFAAIRESSGRAVPPFHSLDPVDLKIEFPSADVAVVTFLLTNEQRTARRSLVLRRDQGAWRIVHLHASNVPAK
jgi:ketosteroid isomerase-like protein